MRDLEVKSVPVFDIEGLVEIHRKMDADRAHGKIVIHAKSRSGFHRSEPGKPVDVVKNLSGL